MVIFHSYVKLPEGSWLVLWSYDPYGSKYLLRKYLDAFGLWFGGLSTFSENVWIHRLNISQYCWLTNYSVYIYMCVCTYTIYIYTYTYSISHDALDVVKLLRKKHHSNNCLPPSNSDIRITWYHHFRVTSAIFKAPCTQPSNDDSSSHWGSSSH